MPRDTASPPLPTEPSALPPEASREALLALWRELFSEDPPKGLSQAFLRRFTAYEQQVRARGGLPRKLLADLVRLEAGTARPAAPALPPGGRLLRDWNGVTHVVEITGDGCLWQGQKFRSLTAVARAITGAHWSGPRFFGMGAAKPAAVARTTRRGPGAGAA